MWNGNFPSYPAIIPGFSMAISKGGPGAVLADKVKIGNIVEANSALSGPGRLWIEAVLRNNIL
jgi:hypothetical protein